MPQHAQSFSELALNALVVRNANQMGYHAPREIQFRAIPHILKGRDVLGLAETGMGKTAAFAAPLAHLLIEKGRRQSGHASRLRALIICPTRELAQQVADETASLCAGTSLRTDCVYGQASLARQIASLSKGVDVLIGTPARVRELVEKLAISLAYVRHLVLDEADRLLDMGFLPQIQWLMQRVSRPCQTLMFTATFPSEVEELAREHLNDPVRVEGGRVHVAGPNLSQKLVEVNEDDKLACLTNVLNDARSQGVRNGILIFCATKRRVGWVAAQLKSAGILAASLHGDRSQTQREQALKDLSRGAADVIVCSDVAARGLHIPAVTFVINYDLPVNPEDFLHRVGRAGHGGGTGRAVSLLSPEQQPRWVAISRMFSLDLPADRFTAPREHANAPKPGPSSESLQRRSRRRDEREHVGTAPDAPRQIRTLNKKKKVRREMPLLTGKRLRPGRARKDRPIDPREKPGRGVKKI
ncbi:MAG TPA: DEAD/DEAH box helicase [Phycisphaerales bacterium]|nr:DEAD/DEAH box helicase [Phycisphaerales bacterium]